MEAIEAILASDVSGSAASVYVRFTPNSGSHLGVLKESEISQKETFRSVLQAGQFVRNFD